MIAVGPPDSSSSRPSKEHKKMVQTKTPRKLSPQEIEAFKQKNIDVQQVISSSEKRVKEQGGEICDWLPYFELTEMRSQEEIVSRALILNAMANIAFNAPVPVIKDYIESNKLTPYLSNIEKAILKETQATLTKQDKINLRWYLESLWAIMWVMNKVDTLDFTAPIPDTMVILCPNLQKQEGSEKFTENTKLRNFSELYEERDLYYRAMWFAREASRTSKRNPNFNMSLILERRRALSWCLDKNADWDDMPQDT